MSKDLMLNKSEVAMLVEVFNQATEGSENGESLLDKLPLAKIAHDLGYEDVAALKAEIEKMRRSLDGFHDPNFKVKPSKRKAKSKAGEAKEETQEGVEGEEGQQDEESEAPRKKALKASKTAGGETSG